MNQQRPKIDLCAKGQKKKFGRGIVDLQLQKINERSGNGRAGVGAGGGGGGSIREMKRRAARPRTNKAENDHREKKVLETKDGIWVKKTYGGSRSTQHIVGKKKKEIPKKKGWGGGERRGGGLEARAQNREATGAHRLGPKARGEADNRIGKTTETTLAKVQIWIEYG